MKPAERDAEMTRFRDGELDVLVGTTVIEVGVDVPAATMMVIEGADRFGLAQLHQLRGRVGRGTGRVVLRLVSDSTDEIAPGAPAGGASRPHDGFALAEKDFELRKEGDVLGSGPERASRGSASPRSRSPTHRDARRPARARTPRRCSTPTAGWTRRARPSPRELEPAGSGGSRPAEPASGA